MKFHFWSENQTSVKLGIPYQNIFFPILLSLGIHLIPLCINLIYIIKLGISWYILLKYLMYQLSSLKLLRIFCYQNMSENRTFVKMGLEMA